MLPHRPKFLAENASSIKSTVLGRNAHRGACMPPSRPGGGPSGCTPGCGLRPAGLPAARTSPCRGPRWPPWWCGQKGPSPVPAQLVSRFPKKFDGI
eukprot:scaffold78_cov14-Prasinocladus_malaysianus.AAC.2